MNNAPIQGNYSPSLNAQIKELQNKPVDVTPVAQPKVELEQKPDAVEITNTPKEPKQKKGIMERFANFVGSIKKLGVNIGEYTKGGVKGAGAFVAGAVATVGSVFTIHQVRTGIKASKENGKNVIGQIFSNFFEGIRRNLTGPTLKKTLKSGKGIAALAAGVGVGVLAFLSQIYKAKLNVNEKSAELDHRYIKNPHNV